MNLNSIGILFQIAVVLIGGVISMTTINSNAAILVSSLSELKTVVTAQGRELSELRTEQAVTKNTMQNISENVARIDKNVSVQPR